ncbi:MAG: DUF4369 domain-containing protein [Bacteroidales bacterium]|nr:DUF4369 domain-containing protein [Bacteroidales bacterium]MCM1147963.1 DUF4369 domain-containing protein [Bacteroidales bacterium]MCM1206887.1 DUF4369 domain-containing protein [Bacillota bacterium]MCM1509520.1 DUF4369 domain-containing protein [Clostridium sp.]
MNKILYTILTVLTCTSCSKSFEVQGTSNISTLDGQMLYLKAVKNGELKNIDSCEVVHGQFKFSGSMDSVCMATIFMDDESVMPIVLEEGNISIQLNNTKQNCTGTVLNDKLSKFIDSYNRLQSQYSDLSHRENQAIMDGADMNAVYKTLTADAESIAVAQDKLITGFICDNFDNILGPGVFMMITSVYEYPELTPWIEDIMSKATDTFKTDNYVKDYMDAAQRNQNIMNGMETPMPQPQAPIGTSETLPPTPAEMAKPSE